ncbi:Hpt domain-containing protein [Massilia endophytica]|uniref:Hpt domain-containing protein n=1 Tax=Massilia endophytica TaxID=2899220 RepID=UPI001E380FE3|nr:Hpt domain-containing protein [Massilia endophytica]UGQ48469.1 Hpt domain-containing protein [Massilia endophytica]
MATPVDPAYRERLKALADKYAAALPERLDAVDRALAAVLAEGAGQPQLEALHHSLHTIAGSAGSFGFRLLGEQARQLEQQVRAMLEQGASWDGAEGEIGRFLEWARRDPISATHPAHD